MPGAPRIVTVSRPVVRPIFDVMEVRLAAAGYEVVPYRTLDAFGNDPAALTQATSCWRPATHRAPSADANRAEVTRCHFPVHRHRGVRRTSRTDLGI